MALFWKCIDHYGSFSSLLWSLCAFSCDKLVCLSHKTFSLTNQIVHYLSPAPVISHAYTDAETPLVMQMTLVHCTILLAMYKYTNSSTAGGCFKKVWIVYVSYQNSICIFFCWIAFPLCAPMQLVLNRSNCTDLHKIATHFHTLIQNTVF